MNAPQPLTLSGTLRSIGNLGPQDLAAFTYDTPRITLELEDGSAVHLVGLQREQVSGMSPLFLERVQIVVQSSEDAEGGMAQLMVDTALMQSRHPTLMHGGEAWAQAAISNEQIDGLAENMPGGVSGFLKQWGYRQFAWQVLGLRFPPVWQPQFDAMGAQEQLAVEFCERIAGPKGERGSPPDPVRLLEMAQALYKAEAAESLEVLVRETAAQSTPDGTTVGVYRYAVEVLIDQAKDLQRENAKLRQQIEATISSDKQTAARARYSQAVGISLPTNGELRDMLFNKLDRLTDTSQAFDADAERGELQGASELVALRADAARVACLEAHASGCIRLDDRQALAPTYVYWGGGHPEQTAREALDAARAPRPADPGSPA